MHGYLNTHRGRDERLKAPANLTKPSRSWWRSVMADYALEPHHVRLLTLAAEAWARAAEAREQLAADGAVYYDRFGQPRAHPSVGIERDARIAFARLVRELDLDTERAPEARPPRR
jgi:phage terminase small subunit